VRAMPTPQIRYSYDGVPTVKAFHQSNAIIRGLMGPFGSGKTSGSIIEIPQRAAAMPPCLDGIRRSRFIVVRNTYGELRDTTIKSFHQWLPPIQFGHWHETNHDYTIEAMQGCHVEVMFRALDRPDHVRHLLSLELTAGWINEAREVPWSIVEALQGRIARYPPIAQCGPYWSGLWLDTNAPDQDSDFFKFFEETKHPKSFAQLFKQPSGLSARAENLAHLSPRYYQNLALGKTKEFVKVYIHGEYGFVILGMAVYGDDYSDEMHLDEDAEPQPGVPIYRGWDFGLTPACVFAQLRPDGKFVVFDELTSKRMGIDRFSDEVLEHCAQSFRQEPEWIDVGDPAGNTGAETDERTCFQIMHSKGIEVEPGLQTPAIRLESVRKPLTTLRSGKPQFRLHPRCRMLRKGFLGGYQYRRMLTKAERYTDKPEKSIYSHVHDALQYICTVIFGAGLKQMRGVVVDLADEEDRMASDATRNPVTGY
jgi:hypothetical protein